MGFVNFYRKPISMFVMVAFTILLCFWANQSPAASAVPASGKKPATSLEKGGGESTGFFEQEKSKPVVKKEKKIPDWQLVVVGIVAVAVIILILVLELKNTKINLPPL